MLRICGYTERRSTWYRYRLNTRSATYSLWPSNVQRNLISILTLLKHVDDAVESSRGYIHRNNWKGGKASGRLEKRDGWRLKTCGVCFWFVDRWDGGAISLEMCCGVECVTFQNLNHFSCHAGPLYWLRLKWKWWTRYFTDMMIVCVHGLARFYL